MFPSSRRGCPGPVGNTIIRYGGVTGMAIASLPSGDSACPLPSPSRTAGEPFVFLTKTE